MPEQHNRIAHPEPAILWAWQRGELPAAGAAAMAAHLEACALCRERAQEIGRLVAAMQARHHAVQPSYAQQLAVLRALEARPLPAPRSVWVDASAHLLRWLAPAVAILATVFVLLRQTATTEVQPTSVTTTTPEVALLSATTEAQFQSAVLELALHDQTTGVER